MTPLVSHRCRALTGNIIVPGDKSISHRALMIGSMAIGETIVKGLLESEDVLRTARAVSSLGAAVNREADGSWRILGRGVGGLTAPASALDMGNSGTSARLLMGILAAHPFAASLHGDASLSKRPMERVMAPLRLMGAAFEAGPGGRLPLTVKGCDSPLPIEYELPVASAQVKSAILLAGLNTPGQTTVIERRPTRDHTELMLHHFGAEVTVQDLPGGARAVTVKGESELTGREVTVPGDISSAAFPLAAAILVEGSKIIIRNVGFNPRRKALVDTLLEMGADIVVANFRKQAGEDVADIEARYSRQLNGVVVPAHRAPWMIDEYPILAAIAACAEGETRMLGIGELRVKESDRIEAMAQGLGACGVEVKTGEDWLAVQGSGKPPQGGAMIAANLDHRIAMAFLVLGMVSERPVAVDDASAIETSFPGFADIMNGLGADIR
ncbi:MAG: 3-phosphoshikimate 1-carboxyvinyltransferase [Rhodospirillales bacterium RIFCSPLOWO2_12_FULL_58_28]|nr:MAG: 3-phosphoshikimate 1-carboxyvinyltransferase [Rhodospirillales bacterium RIFCSPLOWO2_02_FULL_58_16]OHC78318.1 MAG: 3-phosphoshikimate 1-carboxyvinyltransferase [Rhodospirillales bacterium RIFCSPLOWO2_12_FULL_58_28]